MVITESSNYARHKVRRAIEGKAQPWEEFAEFTPADPAQGYGAEFKFKPVIRVVLRGIIGGKVTDEYIAIGSPLYSSVGGRYSFSDLISNFEDLAGDGLLDVRMSIRAGELFHAVDDAGNLMSDMASGAYFDKVNGISFEDFTSPRDFEKCFMDMMNALNADIDIDNRTITFLRSDSVSMTIEFA